MLKLDFDQGCLPFINFSPFNTSLIGATSTQPLYCCFLDLSKAYDRVRRPLLWEVLRRLGVGGAFLQAITSLYDEAQLTMIIEGTSGPALPTVVGLPQGSPLSPTLFGVFADGLIRYVQHKCLILDQLRSTVLGFLYLLTPMILSYWLLLRRTFSASYMLWRNGVEWCTCWLIQTKRLSCASTRSPARASPVV